MSWYRRLVRWLARDMIAQDVMATVAIERAQAAQDVYGIAVQVELREKVAHAMGELEGQAKAFDCIAQAVAARMGGGDDFVMPEDVARAKRGMVH